MTVHSILKLKTKPQCFFPHLDRIVFYKQGLRLHRMSMFVHTSALCPCTLVHCSTGSLIACNVIHISTVCKTTNIVHAKLYYKKFPPVFCFHLWLRIYSTCKILTFSFNKNWDPEDLLPPHLESSWSNPIEWSFHFQCFPQQKPVNKIWYFNIPYFKLNSFSIFFKNM